MDAFCIDMTLEPNSRINWRRHFSHSSIEVTEEARKGRREEEGEDEPRVKKRRDGNGNGNDEEDLKLNSDEEEEDSSSESDESENENETDVGGISSVGFDPMDSSAFRSHVELPTSAQIERFILEKKKEELMKKYGDSSKIK